MHPEIEKLLRLQELDNRLEILRKEIGSRPELVDAQDSRVIGIEQKRADNAAARQGKKIEIDRTQLDINTCDSKIQDVKSKIPSIKANAEYASLMKQISDVQGEQTKSEEQLLYLWDEIESLEREDHEHAKQLDEARKILDEERGTLAEESEEIRKHAAEFLDQREAARKPIDSELLENYDVLFSRYRDRSVVSADGGVCAGCHISLNPQTLNLLSSGKVVVCKNCSRILFS